MKLRTWLPPLCFYTINVVFCKTVHPRSVNLALETVIKFSDDDRSGDVSFINKIQKFLSKLKKAILPEPDDFRRTFDSDKNTLNFEEFLENIVKTVISYDDNELENMTRYLYDGLHKYHYKGCKFYEIAQSDGYRQIMTKTFNHLRQQSGSEIRRSLKKVLRTMQQKKYRPKDKKMLNFISSLYRRDSREKLTDLIKNLRVYRSRTKRGTTSLKKIVREGIKNILFDHYSSLNANARREVKKKVDAYSQDLTFLSDDIVRHENKKDIHENVPNLKVAKLKQAKPINYKISKEIKKTTRIRIPINIARENVEQNKFPKTKQQLENEWDKESNGGVTDFAKRYMLRHKLKTLWPKNIRTANHSVRSEEKRKADKVFSTEYHAVIDIGTQGQGLRTNTAVKNLKQKNLQDQQPAVPRAFKDKHKHKKHSKRHKHSLKNKHSKRIVSEEGLAIEGFDSGYFQKIPKEKLSLRKANSNDSINSTTINKRDDSIKTSPRSNTTDLAKPILDDFGNQRINNTIAKLNNEDQLLNSLPTFALDVLPFWTGTKKDTKEVVPTTEIATKVTFQFSTTATTKPLPPFTKTTQATTTTQNSNTVVIQNIDNHNTETDVNETDKSNNQNYPRRLLDEDEVTSGHFNIEKQTEAAKIMTQAPTEAPVETVSDLVDMPSDAPADEPDGEAIEPKDISETETTTPTSTAHNIKALLNRRNELDPSPKNLRDMEIINGLLDRWNASRPPTKRFGIASGDPFDDLLDPALLPKTGFH